jgi:hypothetical protein
MELHNQRAEEVYRRPLKPTELLSLNSIPAGGKFTPEERRARIEALEKSRGIRRDVNSPDLVRPRQLFMRKVNGRMRSIL